MKMEYIKLKIVVTMVTMNRQDKKNGFSARKNSELSPKSNRIYIFFACKF